MEPELKLICQIADNSFRYSRGILRKPTVVLKELELDHETEPSSLRLRLRLQQLELLQPETPAACKLTFGILPWHPAPLQMTATRVSG